MGDIYSDYIELIPFIHQVGGHSFMLSLDANTVCKTLVPRELNFYKTLPDAVKKFAPKFYSIITVQIIPDDDGYVKFLAKPPTDFQPFPTNISTRIRLKRSGSFEISEEEKLFTDDCDENKGNKSKLKTAALNPWVLKCHRESDFNLTHKVTKDFIVLENLVRDFRYPCILDLKMGTRQYGDAVSLAKKQSKMVKVVTTTSAKLGLRVGGMQVNTNKYLCRNKFYGRALTVTSFQSALVQFLHNGVRLRCDVLPVFIKKLEELAEVISKQDAIRFYTTSLLLIYEGRQDDSLSISTNESSPSPPDVKLDRNNSLGGSDSDLYRKSLNSSLDEEGERRPVLLHRRRRRRRTSSVFNFESSVSSEASSNTSSTSTIFDDCKQFEFTKPTSFIRMSTKSYEESQVDVRIIDFAHSTHKALEDPVVYSGPDQGFLFGLDKLIDMFKAIENDYG